MFDKSNRYITKGIEEKLPKELQLLLWKCIDALKEQEMELDYLQVFELTMERVGDIFFQMIIHTQESPKYSKTYKILAKEMVDKLIFVIDDENKHSTMMFSEEY